MIDCAVLARQLADAHRAGCALCLSGEEMSVEVGGGKHHDSFRFKYAKEPEQMEIQADD